MQKRPLVVFVVCFAAGIVWAGEREVFWPLAGLCAGFIAGAGIFRRYSAACLGLLALGYVLLGAVYGQSRQVLPAEHLYHFIHEFYGEEVVLEGRVVSDVRVKDRPRGPRMSVDVEVHRLTVDGLSRRYAGKVRVNLYSSRGLEYGRLVRVKGRIRRPYDFYNDEKFSYSRYLARRGILFVMNVKKNGRAAGLEEETTGWMRKIGQTREHLRRIFETHLTAGEVPLAWAMVIGQTALPPTVKEAFRQTGTAHILAISGLQIGMVAAMLRMLLRIFPVGHRLQVLLTMGLLAFYVVLTGGSPSVVRAGVMAAVFLTAILLERETDSFNTLAAAGGALLLMDPMNIFDIGFQLSFISVAAILFIFSPVHRGLTERWTVYADNGVVRFFVQSVLVSASAWLGTAGLTAYHFGIVTPVAVLANLAVVPLMSGCLGLGLGLLLCASCFPWAPWAAAAFAAWLKLALNLMVAAAVFCARLPGHALAVEGFTVWYAAGYYLLWAAGIWAAFALLKRKNNYIVK